MMAKRKIRSAAIKVGIRLEPGQRFGFQNFRHSLATFPINKGKCYDCYDPDAAADIIGVLSLSDTSYKPAYKSGVGSDFATGIGTVKATNLVLNPVWAEGMTQQSESETQDASGRADIVIPIARHKTPFSLFSGFSCFLLSD